MSEPIKYFEVLRSLHRGGLSLWLNRKALLPLTTLPIGITFLTLVLIRHYAPTDLSHFTSALIQLPADFCIGLFSSLIILIIMHAPRKKDASKPVVFSMNVRDKRDVLVAGALAHTIFGYLYLGGFALIDMVVEPMRNAAEAEQQVNMGAMLLAIAMLAVGLYAIRFAVLPILVIGKLDIKSFFMQHKAYGFSVPVFFVKIVSMMAVGAVLLLPMGLVGDVSGGEDVSQTTTAMGGIILDLSSAFAAVFAHAWAYAALAIGIRSMIEKN